MKEIDENIKLEEIGENIELEEISINLKVLNNPSKFLNTLISLSSTSSHISIISLYFGVSKEDELFLSSISKCNNLNILVDSIKNYRTDPTNLLRKLNVYKKIKTQKKKFKMLVFKDLFFVQHCKMYIFDDHLILTGANSAGRYFSSTVDRQFLVKSKELAIKILQMMSKFNEKFLNHMNFLNSLKIEKEEKSNSTIFPFTEKEEFKILKKLVRISEGNTIFMSTGYFNPPEEYLELFKKENIQIYIPCPIKHAFSFKLLSFLVRQFYIFIYFRAQKIIGNKIFVYSKEKRAFHSKGMWLFKGPIAYTIIGSTNFNERSSKRDSELNYYIKTEDPDLIKELYEEVKDLQENSKALCKTNLSFLKKFFMGILYFFFGTFL